MRQRGGGGDGKGEIKRISQYFRCTNCLEGFKFRRLQKREREKSARERNLKFGYVKPRHFPICLLRLPIQNLSSRLIFFPASLPPFYFCLSFDWKSIYRPARDESKWKWKPPDLSTIEQQENFKRRRNG